MGYRIALVGCGKMGMALYTGWKAAGTVDRGVLVDPRFAVNRPELNHFEQYFSSIEEADFSKIDVVVLCVKPQVAEDVCIALKKKMAQGTLIITTVAGKEINFYKEIMGCRTPVVRAMPNTPAAIDEGITGMVAATCVSRIQVDMAHRILSAIGRIVLLLDEDKLHTVTALSGSGPAYVYYMMEAMTEVGVKQGLSRPIAAELAAYTVRGAALMATHNGRGAKELREDVTSPAGTTAAGLSVLMDEEDGLLPLMQRTIAAAEERSRGLAYRVVEKAA